MKINFTKAEYRVLLDLVSLGQWVLTAHDTKEDPKKEKYREVVQKVFSYAKEFGYEKLIMYETKYQKYYETREYDESEKDAYLEKYEENIFWDELINRLAERDFINEHGVERANEMPFEERMGEIYKHEIKYSAEFEKHGLERVIIGET